MNDALHLRVRVRVLEAWSDVVLDLAPPTRVDEVKRRALEAVHITADAGSFLVKFRGAELQDESRTLADEQVPTDAALIVMRRHRVPVR